MKRDRRYRIEQRERVIRNRKRFINDCKVLTNMVEGELEKRHPLDCGNPGCLVCHPHKSGKNYSVEDKIERVIQKEIEEQLDSDGE
jgi:hypothetical protein